MLTLIAQAESSPQDEQTIVQGMENLFQSVTGIFSRGDALAQPGQLIPHLQELSAMWAIVFLIAGSLCMLNGYKYYRFVTIGLALMLGAFTGYVLGEKISAPYVVAGCLGLLLAVAAWPMMKFAVAGLGGLAGAFVGANLWGGIMETINSSSQSNLPTDTYWVGALLGLIMFGIAAFVLFKLSVIIFTSVGGATFAVLGALALLLSYEPWQTPIAEQLAANSLVVPMLVFVPALIGLILQETNWAGGKVENT